MGGRVQINNLSREGGNSIEIRPVVSEQKNGTRQLTNGNTYSYLQQSSTEIGISLSFGLRVSRTAGCLVLYVEQDVLGMTLFSI